MTYLTREKNVLQVTTYFLSDKTKAFKFSSASDVCTIHGLGQNNDEKIDEHIKKIGNFLLMK